MKKYLLIFLISLFGFAFKVNAEEITSFNQEIHIKDKGILEISESITYDFGLVDKHGIFRNIPYRYNSGFSYYEINIYDIAVLDEHNNLYKFSTTKEGGQLRIKIGDPHRLITGKHIYNINYKVGGAVSFYDDFDEVYWNVTGSNWPVKIKNIKSTVFFPESLEKDDLKSSCYAGAYNSQTKCDSIKYNLSKDAKVSSISFVQDYLNIKGGLTTAISFPKGLVKKPSIVDLVINFFLNNYFVFLPIIVFIIYYLLWRKNGKDPKGRGTIITQFDAPENLSPMSVGILYDEKADNKDFSSNIISLAVKGYIKIILIEGKGIFKSDDYAFLGLNGKKELTTNEKLTLDKLFSFAEKPESKKISKLKQTEFIEDDKKVLFLSALKNKFYTELEEINENVYEELVKEGYFVINPNTVRKIYYFVPFIILIFSFYFFSINSMLDFLAYAITFIIIVVFSRLMPKRTKKGVLAREHILGLKRYLEVAEKDRMNFHYSPKKNPQTFEKLLPFAIALGVEKNWVKQFEGNFIEYKPLWYSGTNGAVFSLSSFSSSMNSFTSSMNSISSSRPASSGSTGGGFSGGGFGGGGGGSW